jgi:partner of Y14 and mago
MPSATSPDRPATPISTSGIQTLPTGHAIIPSSVRPDGSTRKEIKVRPGYRPPEDQEKYRNRNVEARSNIGTGGIPGAEPASTPVKGAEEKNKNAKRREAARKKAATIPAAIINKENQIQDAAISEITNGVQNTQLDANPTEKLKQAWRDPNKLATNNDIASAAAAAAAVDEATEREKKARNLKKKLRQARELKEKKEGGGELLPEQLAKVTKIQELIRDLDKLGYDADGEPKASVDAASSYEETTTERG